MQECIIFGGSGFIGSHLTERLVKRGYSVTVFDQFKYGNENISGILDKIEVYPGNFLKTDDLNDAIEGKDLLFHYISTTTPATSVNDPVFDIESNIAGSVRLLQTAVKQGVRKVIFPSSGGTIYGNAQSYPISESTPPNPENPYAISKLAIERYLHYFQKTYGLEYLILRYSNPYGERQNPYAKQGVIPIFLNKIKNNEKPVIFGDGSSTRDYVYIRDAIDATIAVIEASTRERIFNIGSGRETSLIELLKIISDVTGKEVAPEYRDDSGVYLSRFVLDISRLTQETGWVPTTSLFKGITRTWTWINERK